MDFGEDILKMLENCKCLENELIGRNSFSSDNLSILNNLGRSETFAVWSKLIISFIYTNLYCTRLIIIV